MIFGTKRFGTLCLWTLGATFFVVIAGSIVRSAGAGMGCPDWPTCFGQWIPPTTEAQLPENYQEIYAHRGYANTQFNALKTWLEYLNRLSGVLAGLLVLTLALTSLGFWRSHRAITLLSFSALFLLVFQAWLGGQVVATNLLPHLITLHLFLALVLLLLLIWTYARHKHGTFLNRAKDGSGRIWGILTLLIMMQAMFGAEVREDMAMVQAGGVTMWSAEGFAALGPIFSLHRGFSFVLLVLALLLSVKGPIKGNSARWPALIFLGMILAQIGIGVWMSAWYRPGVTQALHMILGALSFCWAAYQFLVGHKTVKTT